VLAARGAASATTIAAALPITRQAVVQHLAVLRDAGLVSGDRVGREVRYAVRPQQLDAAARWMLDRAAEWDRRLESVKRLAEADSRPRGATHFPTR
jgi:DNA-binding transcriptional ArsR family regulator